MGDENLFAAMALPVIVGPILESVSSQFFEHPIAAQLSCTKIQYPIAYPHYIIICILCLPLLYHQPLLMPGKAIVPISSL